MKSIFNIAFAVVSAMLISQSTHARADQKVEKEIQVGFSDAYIPSGFDSNSESYVVASGIFPNSCYRWKEADVDHPTQNLHEISATASVSQGMCLMVLVPFTKEIRLGKLPVGIHIIKLLNGDGTYIEKQITIEE